MLTVEEWMDYKDLAAQGCSVREIARRTGKSRNTIRRHLLERTPEPFQTPVRLSKLDPYKEYVNKRYEEYGLSAIRLLKEIEPMGYCGSVDLLRRHLTTLKPLQKAMQKATVRFETPPGQQAQVDWGYCGTFIDPVGNAVRVDVFVMVLGFSRMMYIEFCTSMIVQELLRCHINAFEYFGGWPKKLLYDNMSQVKIPGGGMNPLFIDFCGHYDIVPQLCRVRRARTKGKVERMVDYIKDNFLRARIATDVPDLNVQGRQWLNDTANIRIHATTDRRPVDLLPKEGLTAVCAIAPYRISETCTRKVNVEGFVLVNRSRYSVPPEHIGKTVVVEQKEQQVIVRCQDLVIAEHPKAPRPGSCMTQREHVEALWKISVGDGKSTQGEDSSVSGLKSPPRWQMTFTEDVASTPLEVYERELFAGGSLGGGSLGGGSLGGGSLLLPGQGVQQ